MTKYAEVAVDAPAGYNRTFTYSIPDGMSVAQGHLVRVPFGRRVLSGFVFGLSDKSPVPQTRDIHRLAYSEPVLSYRDLAIASWASEHYMASLFDCAALLAPPGLSLRANSYVSLTQPDAEPGRLTEAQGRVVTYLKRRGRVRRDTLVRSLGHTAERALGPLAARGIVEGWTEIRKPKTGPLYATYVELADPSFTPEERARRLASSVPKQAALLEHLEGLGAPMRLAEATRDYGAAAVKGLEDKGFLRRNRIREDMAQPRIATYIEAADTSVTAEERAQRLDSRVAQQAALLDHVERLGAPMRMAEATKAYGSSAVKGLESKGLLRLVRIREDRDPLAGRSFPPDEPPSLTPRQRLCVDRIRSAIDAGTPRVFLLRGVTASGKTEVYMRALSHAMSRGRRGIVMVPELALTPQTIDRFGRRFPGQVAVLHSGLSRGEHFDQWWHIRQGGYGVVIGSRSAVFAPQPDLGVIVMDEEHEWTYKQQDSSPHYHAREAAIKLAQLANAVVILGSATPDVVSNSRAVEGEFELLEMPHRIRTSDAGETPLPRVRVVDLRRELREGNRSIFSRALTQAMEFALREGEQVILYLNRRGSGSLVQCRDCGHTMHCRRCDLPMTYHAQSARLLCHRCGHRQSYPQACPRCRGPRIRYLGLGTQRVVEEVEKEFPGVKTMRWDRDAASTRGSNEQVMAGFLRGDAQVLVGTQMIAKGLHFPDVTVVGVMCADIGLYLPDYRASERVFQLLCQVAGRTGRGPRGGQVVVQTYSPDHYAIMAAAEQDYERFFQEELAYRDEQDLPPFTHLIHLVFAHTGPEYCRRQAVALGEALRRERLAWGITDVDVVGPAPAYPPRVGGRYRWHVVLRGHDPRTLLEKVTIPPGWSVDVDPMSVM